jgi:DNA-binding NarL/FixJ family response regulator
LPGFILLNFALRGEETTAYVELLISQSPATNIVVVGNDLSDEQILDCLLAGAKGYQNIRELPQYIERIIKAIAIGEAWITRRMTAYLLDYIRTKNLAMPNNLAGYALPTEATISH